ncbi:hypothetical protein VFPPC_08956 [Pochonia chlamydosporia 170]|uniref:Uncharacterized protein n=1 Tax=Pochonia chlamydosporia 170 TaxID=1380566 RepID=A0A179FCA1_METCM|nr:hypothetical protein VFPPC_08956 [Pochonia chlamydosporia 170]OAQ63048.1 hypothetical protein VFPPC_08956 [Pochonia chlamydosporia 170]
MGFSLKKKTATAQWEFEKEQQRAEFDKRELQTSLSRSRPIQDSTSLAYPPPAPHLSQKVPQNFGAPPTPEFLSGIAVCVLNAGRFERQESGSDVFDCVAVAAQFGVDLLHSYPGFKALTKTGAQILMRASSRNIRCRDPTQAPSHAADYLRRVTDAFPVIAVHNLKAMNARTNKGRWEVPQDRMFPPHHAAVIELNLNLVNRLVEARNSVRRQRNDQNAWERLHTLVFRIGVTIAHELCHVFTSYLLYNERQHTPKEVTYAAEYSSDTIGESGRFWESETFGGYVDMRQGSQIERVAIRHGTRTLSNVMIIPPSFCRTMLKRGKYSIPPRPQDPSTS